MNKKIAWISGLVIALVVVVSGVLVESEGHTMKCPAMGNVASCCCKPSN